MLNDEQYLLICLMEECAEVAQRASKALRFGLNEVQPGQDFDNRARLEMEVIDLRTVLSELQERRVIASTRPSVGKVAKIDKFMSYSRELGTLV